DAAVMMGVDASIPMGNLTPACGEDIFEPDNNTGDISPLTAGALGAFPNNPLQVCLGDVDLYAFAPAHDTAFSVDVEFVTGDTLLARLFTANGTFVAEAVMTGTN